MLSRGRVTVMSDTPAEVRDHLPVIRRAHGSVLIVGLGLGMVARAIGLKPEVTKVTVIELSPDVIALTGPWLTALSPKVEIIQADIFAWSPPRGTKYEVAWFDIWDDLCSDNLPQMSTLHRKFARCAAWKGSWGRELTQTYFTREKNRRGTSIFARR